MSMFQKKGEITEKIEVRYYSEIKIEIIWKTAKKRLPILKTVIEELLNEQ
jgi:uncharacterized protein with HEPN domain